MSIVGLSDGTYDDTVPEWLVGKSIWDANTIIVDHLRDKNVLVDAHEFNHSYLMIGDLKHRLFLEVRNNGLLVLISHQFGS